ncbi:hypothetical protein FRC02_002312 [Tulasnella sp. 418]|nr:hypothetical protein FRC02_002312 [Tulasnella sp. 418]
MEYKTAEGKTEYVKEVNIVRDELADRSLEVILKKFKNAESIKATIVTPPSESEVKYIWIMQPPYVLTSI